MKELFESASKPHEGKPLESRADLRKQVYASYYGLNLDEEDGTLLEYEALKEKEAFENLLRRRQGEALDGWEPLPGDKGDGEGWRLPNMDEV